MSARSIDRELKLLVCANVNCPKPERGFIPARHSRRYCSDACKMQDYRARNASKRGEVLGQLPAVTRPCNQRPADIPQAETAIAGPVVAVLNERWRIVWSSPAPHYRMWVLQRSKRRADGIEWTGQSFCQSRQCLLTAVDEKVIRAGLFYPGGESMSVDPAAYAAVTALPQRVYKVTPRPA